MKNTIFFSITRHLLDIYTQSFSAKISDYKIYVDCSNSYAPITYRTKKEIILNCNINYANQIAFQLSHELCHAIIPCSVPNNLRWFEETFAILASYVFPLLISEIELQDYTNYFNISLNERVPKCVKSVSFPSSEELLILEAGSGTANYNDYGSYWNIAQVLLPLCKNNPDIWKAVPFLCQIPKGLSFEDSLRKWLEISPPSICDSVSVIVSAFLFR